MTRRSHAYIRKAIHIALTASLSMVAASILAAQNISPEETQLLRNDLKAAEEAIDHIAKNATDSNLLKEADNAKIALSRASDRLNSHAGQAGSAGDIYDKGNKYPTAANVSIKDFEVPIGAKTVQVPVTLDKPSPNTVIAYVRVSNGQGGRATPDIAKSIIFRPGDPLTKTLAFDVNGMDEGNTVKAVQSSVPDGGNRQGGGIIITAKSGATNEPTESNELPPRKFTPLGNLCYSATGETIQFDDKGGPNSFSTALSHGRTQVGNGETGYYGTVDMSGFTRTSEGLILSSRRLDKPVTVGSPPTLYSFLATMLSGHRTPETQFKYGSVEWVVKMPNRKGAWPALWLLPVSGWPPEIDVYEGFGYNGSWKFPSNLSTNLHGGHNSIHKFSRPAMNMKASTFGLQDTLDSEFHTFAVTVDKEWITIYLDTVETMRYANPFAGEMWYPLTNVAVKAFNDSSYNDGCGDMALRSLKIWRSE